MKSKRIVSAVLLVFVATSVVYLVASESMSTKTPADGAGSQAVVHAESTTVQAKLEETAAQKRQLVAYYFHGDYRCHTCLTMERLAYEALEDGFSDALASGRIVWKSVNVDSPGQEHFNIDYGLTSSALVLVSMVDGRQNRWVDLQRIWDLVGDEQEFKDYVRSEVATMLEDKS